jgi:hypothetical protein
MIIITLLLASCERPNDTDTDDDGIPPAVPTGLSFYFAYDGEILIEWNPNAERDLDGYNIYRKVNDENYELIEFTHDLYYLDDSLSYTDRYTYKISALDNSGRESEPTDSISAIPANKYNPQKPRYPEINARNWQGDKYIYLSWNQGYETDIAGYNIYRGFSESFTADSTTLAGFAETPYYSDYSASELYTDYYYKIKAVDKGGLLSSETSVLADEIYDMPAVIFPANNAYTEYFASFKIKALSVPATYKIILQTNEYFGEIWSTEVSPGITDDTLDITFNAWGVSANTKYYWRIITYSGGSGPNSISPLYSFSLKPE